MEIVAQLFGLLLVLAIIFALVPLIPGMVVALARGDVGYAFVVMGRAYVRIFKMIYKIAVVLLSVVSWVLTAIYNLIKRRALPGLPDLPGSGGGDQHDLQQDPTAPVATRSKVGAREQIEAIREGRFGDLMFFGMALDGFHALIAAKTRSGKAQAILMQLLAWLYLSRPRSNTITLDPKGEFYEEFRDRGGRHYLYTVMADHSESSAINVIPDQQASTELIENLLSGDQGYFSQAAKNWFTNICRATRYRSVVDVYDLLYDPDGLEILADTDKKLYALIHGKNEKRTDDILDTLRTALSMLDDPLVRRVFDSRGAEEPDPAEGGCHIYIGIPLKEAFAKAFSPWATALIDRLVNLASNCGQDSYLILDEGASFADIERVSGYFAMSAGAGVRVILSVQDLSQMQQRIGRERTRSTVNNTSYRIIGPLSDPETAQILSEVSGEVETERLVESRPGDRPGVFAELGENDEEGRRYERNLRNRLSRSNIMSLEREWFIEAGQNYRIEQIQVESYYTFRDQLPGGWEEDLRGIPPEREEQAAAEEVIAEAETIARSSQDGEETVAARSCPACGEGLEAHEKEICETCGEELD